MMYCQVYAPTKEATEMNLTPREAWEKKMCIYIGGRSWGPNKEDHEEFKIYERNEFPGLFYHYTLIKFNGLEETIANFQQRIELNKL